VCLCPRVYICVCACVVASELDGIAGQVESALLIVIVELVVFVATERGIFKRFQLLLFAAIEPFRVDVHGSEKRYSISISSAEPDPNRASCELDSAHVQLMFI